MDAIVLEGKRKNKEYSMESRGPGSVRKAHTEDILRESIDDLEESI